MQTIAILPASGIGDALLMMIAAHQLKEAGHAVTVYHNQLPELGPWFPGLDLKPIPSDLKAYQLIIAENDNSPKIKELIKEYRPTLSLFYPSYKAGKHAPLGPNDHCFDVNLPMADNVGIAASKMLGTAPVSKNNGIVPLIGLQHRANPLRVLIHPTSSSAKKNWKTSRFLRLATRLKTEGLFPCFVVSPQERPEWEHIKNKGFALSDTATLSDLASLIYESGYVIGNDSLIGHLASNLDIPTLIIADNPKRLKLWRPNWGPCHLVFPPTYLPKRIREKHWQQFISTKKALKSFLRLKSTHNQ